MAPEYVVVAPPPVEAYSPEWIALNFLKEWTAEDMQIAIRKNMEVDFSSFVGQLVDRITEEVLNWFKTYRPDLYGALATEEGSAWIKKNVKRMIWKIQK